MKLRAKEKYWVKIKYKHNTLPLGNRVKFGAYRDRGINFLALDKPKYQLLASY